MPTANFDQTVAHLFRHESSKLVSALTKVFGPKNLQLAEDVAQDTLVKAMERWKFDGIPSNPSAWLFAVARNRALDVLRREKHHLTVVNSLSPLLLSEYSAHSTLQKELQPDLVEDEQLRMMFVCAHPALPEEAQVALMLKTLCGFSVAEISKAYLTNDENITKRLYRAREKLRECNVNFDLPPTQEFDLRLDGVLTAIYLIFNEGYNASHTEHLVREDLIEEALRLGYMLTNHRATCQTKTYALLALMCLHASRVQGRVSANGNLLTLRQQDRSLWNKELIQQGKRFLSLSSSGDKMSPYHVEAMIAYEHCIATSYEHTNWMRIRNLYEVLLTLKADALTQFNYAVITAEVSGPAEGLALLKSLEKELDHYYLFHAAKGDWLTLLGQSAKAVESYLKALTLTHATMEKRFIQEKIELAKKNRH